MKNFTSSCTLVPESQPSNATADRAGRMIFWHRELPPLDAVAVAEHHIEATSRRVPGTLAYRDTLWLACHSDLIDQLTVRLRQEIDRLGGRYAHILEESITSRHDDVSGEAWLAGRFRYTLLR